MNKRVKSILLRCLGFGLAGLVLLLGLAVLCLPAVLTHVDFAERTFDLAAEPGDPADGSGLFSNRTATVRFRFDGSPTHDLAFRATGRLLDWDYTLRSDFNYSLLGLSADGTFAFSFDGTPFRVDGSFAWSAADGWSADARLDPTRFDETDPLLGALLTRALADSYTNVVCSGEIAFEAHAATTNGLALPTWSAQARLGEISAELAGTNGTVAVSRLRLTAGADGLGAHTDIRPMFPRAESVSVADIALTNAFASVRATEKSYLVTEAGADVWGGQLRLYALFLNPEKLNAGVTLFLDNVETEPVLNRLAGFQGEASGRLHGKLPLRLREGRRVSLGDAYLYSTPGETGTLRLAHPEPIMDSLELSGIGKRDRDNLANALSDMSYTALSVRLQKEASDDDSGNAHALAFKLEGSATRGKTTVPVILDVTLHGPLERLINTGLMATGKTRKP